MSTKKLLFIFIPVVLIVAVAAFVGGRFLNRQVSGLGFLPMGNGTSGVTSVALSFNPAPELPTTPPDAEGVFADRADNAIYLQTFSADAGDGLIAVSADGSISAGEGSIRVEVVITKDTKIYRDATEFGANLPDENTTVQQVVEPGSPDEFSNQTTLTVWGRKNGDRIIADVILYTAPMMIQQP